MIVVKVYKIFCVLDLFCNGIWWNDCSAVNLISIKFGLWMKRNKVEKDGNNKFCQEEFISIFGGVIKLNFFFLIF